MTFKRFLVPVDYSEHAGAALTYAAALARSLQGELIVLHVVESDGPPTPTYVAPMAGYDPMHKEMADGARNYLDGLAPLMEGVPNRCLVRGGDPGEQILAVAQEEAVDAIIMATRGRVGMSRLLMGSVAEAVMRHSTVPVMTLRDAMLVPYLPARAVEHPPML